MDHADINTLVICPTSRFLADIALLLSASLPGARIEKLTAFPSRTETSEKLGTPAPNLCLLEYPSTSTEAAQTLQALQAAAPGLPVIALLAGNNADTILQCLRQGAADFLIHPFTPEQAAPVFEKVLRNSGAAAPLEARGRIVAVIPAKGGAGSTTIACDLAFQCKRLGLTRILLADMDPLAGTLSFLLRLNPAYTFMDVLGRADNLDKDLWKQMTVSANGIEVLLAPETPPDPQRDLPSAAPILDFARKTYEFAVMDCGGPYGAWNVSIAQASDEILLVSTNELSSLYALERSVAYLRGHGVAPGKMKFVVSRYTAARGLHADKLPGVLHSEPFQIVADAPGTVHKSLIEGKQLPANSPIGKQLASLAERLVGPGPESSEKPVQKKRSLLTLFGRS